MIVKEIFGIGYKIFITVRAKATARFEVAVFLTSIAGPDDRNILYELLILYECDHLFKAVVSGQISQ